jgi:hypothetical protein
MAFASTLTINNAAAAAKDFVLNLLSGTTSERLESTSTLTHPLKFVIRHSFTPAKKSGATVISDAVDRHTVSFAKTVTDADDNVHTATVSMTLTVPRVSDITRTDLNDLIAFTRNFSGVTGNVDALLRNEA